MLGFMLSWGPMIETLVREGEDAFIRTLSPSAHSLALARGAQQS